jgi:hypothetical protein
MQDRHHRLPTSRKGKSTPENISIVSKRLHQAYHQLFQNKSPEEIARDLTSTWIDPDYYMVAIPRNKRKPLVIKRGNIRILIRIIEGGKSRWAEARTDLKER